jgi:hypothetical protein
MKSTGHGARLTRPHEVSPLGFASLRGQRGFGGVACVGDAFEDCR